MALTLQLARLRSRQVDTKLKAQRAASRVAGAVAKTGLLAKLKRFGGWAIGSLFNFFNIDFDDIWDILVDAYVELKEFDWNATDKELDKSIEQNNQQILSAGAKTLGEQLGIGTFRIANMFVGKFLPGTKGRRLAAAQGMKVPVFSKRVALALAEDANSQLRQDTENFLRTAGRAMTSNAMIQLILTARRNELFGLKSITTEAATEGTIAGKIERKIEKLPKDWQKPVEALLDGFESGMISAGYVIASEADDDLEILRYAEDERRQSGDVITLEVWPNGGEEDGEEGEGRPMVFTGTPEEVQEAATTLLPAYDLLDDDEGDLAVPINWALKPGADRPQLAVNYRAKGKKTTHTLHIPHYSGGRNPKLPPYKKGPWLAFWTLSDGSKLQVYAATKTEAQRQIDAMARSIPSRYKKGTPIIKQSGQRINRETLYPVSATFFGKGAEAPSTWKAYLSAAS